MKEQTISIILRVINNVLYNKPPAGEACCYLMCHKYFRL